MSTPSSIPASDIQSADRAARRTVELTAPPRPSVWTRYQQHRGGLLGLVVVAALAAVAILASAIAPYDPLALGDVALSAPSRDHPMGTDHLGRDILSSVVWGLRISLVVGIGSALISVVVGILVGAPAGYFRGRLDGLLMRATDAFMVLPTFFLILLVASLFGASIGKLIALIGITNWPPIARLVRAEFLSLREREFTLAARTVGVGHFMIMLRHILPNALPVVIPTVSLRTAGAIITEASLSFLGVGDPNVVSLGQMLMYALQFMRMAWWTAAFPGLAIFVVVLALNLVGDALNDALNPRLKEK